MTGTDRRHSVDFLFVLLVFALTAICAVTMIAAETGGYRRILSSVQKESDLEIAESYITQKVRRGRSEGAVSTGTFDGCSALYLKQDIDGTAYVTILYAFDGTFRELFCAEDADLTRDAGERIMDITQVTFSSNEDSTLIRADIVTEDGMEDTILLSALPEGGAG